MGDAQPKITDQFWFDLSEGMVKNAIDNLNKAIDNFNALILWGYGIYTASAIFTVEFKKIKEPWIVVLLVVPYILFIMVYWKAQVAKSPVTIEFDYRSPDEIQKAYVFTYGTKYKELQTLKIYTFITLFALSCVLMAAFWLKNSQKEVVIPASSFSGSFNKGNNALYVSGKYGSDSLINVQLKSIITDVKTKNISEKDTTFTILTSHEGIFYQTIQATSGTKSISVRISYNEPNFKKTAEQTFIVK